MAGSARLFCHVYLLSGMVPLGVVISYQKRGASRDCVGGNIDRVSGRACYNGERQWKRWLVELRVTHRGISEMALGLTLMNTNGQHVPSVTPNTNSNHSCQPDFLYISKILLLKIYHPPTIMPETQHDNSIIPETNKFYVRWVWGSNLRCLPPYFFNSSWDKVSSVKFIQNLLNPNITRRFPGYREVPFKQ